MIPQNMSNGTTEYYFENPTGNFIFQQNVYHNNDSEDEEEEEYQE